MKACAVAALAGVEPSGDHYLPFGAVVNGQHRVPAPFSLPLPAVCQS